MCIKIAYSRTEEQVRKRKRAAGTVPVQVEGADGVCAHDGLGQRIVGLQEPGVVILQQLPALPREAIIVASLIVQMVPDVISLESSLSWDVRVH